MELLKSYNQYRDLTAPFRGRKNVYSNVYFLPGAVKEEIAAGRLFIQPGEDSLLLFQKEQNFYRFYFYTAEEYAAHVHPECTYPMVAELPFGEKMDVKTETQRDILLSWGFQLGRESGRMSAVPAGLRRAENPVPFVGRANIGEADELYRLLYETFDPLYAFLPDQKQLLKDIQNGTVLVSRKEGCICGMLRLDHGKNYASVSQLAVAPECRNCGIGTSLLEEFHRQYWDTTRFWHWVDLNNKPAVSLYQHEGYAFDGRYANEYIKL